MFGFIRKPHYSWLSCAYSLVRYRYWNVLNRFASREGFNFLYDSAPWRSHVSNGNAALLASLDAVVPTEQFTLPEGMDTLPLAMVEEFLNTSDT